MIKQLNYANSFERAILAVHNHVVYFSDGKVGPMNPGTVPPDVHDLDGHRLPSKLYISISKQGLSSQLYRAGFPPVGFASRSPLAW